MLRQAAKPGKMAALSAARLLALIFCLAAVPVVFAATPQDYAGRIERARGHIETLLYTTTSLRTGERRDTASEKESLDDIRSDIPATEKIEWSGSTVETSNQWLHDQLKAFEDEADKKKRIEILSETGERLSALQAIVEMTAGPASARSKDEDKQKLAEILDREEYRRVEEKEESLFQKWSRQFWEWMKKIFPEMEMPAPSEGGGLPGLSLFLQVVLYAVVICLIIFVVYKFAPFLFERFGKRIKKEKKERVILGERIAEDQSGDTLFDEAERLARDGDMRGAIRKGYIAMLCELSDRKIIGLARHKTNRDYLRDVRKQRELYNNVAGLTNTFERHWYGDQLAEVKDWDEFRQNFRQTLETARV